MSSQGPLSAGAGADDGGVGGVAWSNPGNILASDDARATSSMGNNTSKGLNATGFGFTIPGGSTIGGILVEIERSSSNTIGSPHDLSLLLLKAGSTTGSDKALGTTWATTDAYTSYGSSADLWGAAWTATDINDANFGCKLRVIRAAGKGTTIFRVDHVRITVTYTAGPSFIAQPNQRLTQAVMHASFY